MLVSALVIIGIFIFVVRLKGLPCYRHFSKNMGSKEVETIDLLTDDETDDSYGPTLKKCRVEEISDDESLDSKKLDESTDSKKLADSNDFKKLDEPSISVLPTPSKIPQELVQIGGVTVSFPLKPYPSQIALVGKVIQGCTKKENCLLESPTGTGKTFALLCGVLAWLKHHKREMALYQTNLPQDKEKSLDLSYEELDEDSMMKSSVDEKPPKIYYGTRTHRQISQVVKELGKTAYRDMRMTILSSREHSCIQDTDQNKTQLCNELLDPLKKLGCQFNTEKNKTAASHEFAYGIQSPWDLEDFVSFGKDIQSCPYFGARGLMENAEIIFCPYNYVIDPSIRNSMKIVLKNNVLIVDEAHNIEGFCRDAAGVDISIDTIDMILNDISSDKIRSPPSDMIFADIREYLHKFSKFIETQKVDHEDGGLERLSKRWTGEELKELLKLNQLGGRYYQVFHSMANTAIQQYNRLRDADPREQREMKGDKNDYISQSTKALLEEILMGMGAINDPQLSVHYRACIVEKVRADRKGPNNNRWYRANADIVSTNRIRTLQLMCMNSAVIFQPIAKEARSVILASGTLSPTLSFESELGTKFPHFLNANHIIPKEQVCVQLIDRGPSGKEMKATYQNVSQLSFKDDLGNIVISVCKNVPHGVLCFFSSYAMMQQQIDRWKAIGMWDTISEIKETFIEPKHSGDLNEFMSRFREVITYTSAGPVQGITGAIMFGVFRGKVAEGIDFSDNEARCVMAIGIPYPVLKQPSVKLKYDYNTSRMSRGLLSGSEWYSVQAFRALNQALGRCIRHRNDWGAILLIDSRFKEKGYTRHLPKWIKSMCGISNMNSFQQNLRDFVQAQKRHAACSIET